LISFPNGQMDKAALTIRRDWARVEVTEIPALMQASSSQVSDVTAGAAILDLALRRMAGPERMAGLALPIMTSVDDNLAPYAALSVIKPGDLVIVTCTGNGKCALLGDHIIGLYKNAGAAGVLVNGFVRDLDGLKKLNLPVFALGTSARAPSKRGPGTVGVSIAISSTTIQAGDFIVIDEDGAATIPSTNIHTLEPKLEALFAQDRLIQDRVASGATKPPNFESLLSQAGVHWMT
jgi:4-hydroxy-4-methyl-2-oxoglutarate aldolase